MLGARLYRKLKAMGIKPEESGLPEESNKSDNAL